MTQKEVKDLLTLIDHARRDISYGTGGTYLHNDDDGTLTKLDTQAIKATERAIEHVKRLIIKS